MTENTLLHIGLSKSGTTALQKLLFARHPGLVNIGKPDYGPHGQMLALRRWVMDEGPADEAWAVFEACISPLYRQGKPVVLSEESFSAKVPERQLAAERLQQMFGGARILITAREPVAMLESLYLAWLTHAGKRYPYMNLDAWLDRQWALWKEQGDSYLFRADAVGLADLYSRYFGADRVTIMAFEQLRQDPLAFCGSLASLIGIASDATLKAIAMDLSQANVNQRKTQYNAGLARLPLQHLRPVVPKPLKFLLRQILDRGKPADPGMSAAWRERLREWSAPSNRLMRDRWGVEVERYGYAI